MGEAGEKGAPAATVPQGPAPAMVVKLGAA
jgi:hypothetical protein